MDRQNQAQQRVNAEMAAMLLQRARSVAQDMLAQGYDHQDIVAAVFRQFGMTARDHVEALKDNGYQK